MGHDLKVYDLGTATDLEQAIQEVRPTRATVVSTRTAQAPAEGLWPDVVLSLSLLMPGVSQIVRGQVALGLFFLSSLAFLASMTWAILHTLDRLAGTLDLLGLSMYFVFWTLDFHGTSTTLSYLAYKMTLKSQMKSQPKPAIHDRSNISRLC